MRGPTNSSSVHSSRRLVLRGWGSEAEVMRFAKEGGYELLRDESSDIENGIVRDVMWRLTPGIVLQYAVDSRSGCSIFVVAGEPADDVEGIAESIENGLHPLSLKELLAAVDRARTPQESYAVILRAGIGAPQQVDKRFLKRIRRALRSKDPTIRSAGMWATAYSRWPEFRPDLQALARDDPDPRRAETPPSSSTTTPRPERSRAAGWGQSGQSSSSMNGAGVFSCFLSRFTMPSPV